MPKERCPGYYEKPDGTVAEVCDGVSLHYPAFIPTEEEKITLGLRVACQVLGENGMCSAVLWLLDPKAKETRCKFINREA